MGINDKSDGDDGWMDGWMDGGITCTGMYRNLDVAGTAWMQRKIGRERERERWKTN